jgi:hypothetical protein
VGTVSVRVVTTHTHTSSRQAELNVAFPRPHTHNPESRHGVPPFHTARALTITTTDISGRASLPPCPACPLPSLYGAASGFQFFHPHRASFRGYKTSVGRPGEQEAPHTGRSVVPEVRLTHVDPHGVPPQP